MLAERKSSGRYPLWCAKSMAQSLVRAPAILARSDGCPSPSRTVRRAYSAVYAAINDGTVTMYTGDGGAFYTNGSQVSCERRRRVDGLGKLYRPAGRGSPDCAVCGNVHR